MQIVDARKLSLRSGAISVSPCHSLLLVLAALIALASLAVFEAIVQ
jgi:hypothetical protein